MKWIVPAVGFGTCLYSLTRVTGKQLLDWGLTWSDTDMHERIVEVIKFVKMKYISTVR